MSRNHDDRNGHDNRNRGRSRYDKHRSKGGHANTSVDSGYGGSAITTPKLSREDAPRAYHVESARQHDAKPSRRASSSHGNHSLDEKDGDYNRHDDPDSDTDYDPRDKYYIDVDDDEYENMSFRNGEASKDDRAREDRQKRGQSDTSSVSGRGGQDLSRDKSSTFQGRDRASSTGSSDPGDRRRKYSSRNSDASSRRTDSRDRRGPVSSRKPRSKASAASHSRHESNYHSLSPIPSEWGESDDTSSPVRPRRPSSRRRPRGNRSAKSTKTHDAAAGLIDPDGETANSFLQKLTKGIDVKSVGRVGLDAAAVAAIKVAVGTRVPWQQRIPKTIAAGAAAAIMDFVVKKTSFQPKGMIGTIFARQFVEIILANLVVNPVSAKVTGAAQNLTGGGKIAVGSRGGGGGKGRR